MASYKLIQDIEAEDKILGPLTLRQFIFALAAALLLYICFVVATKGFAFLLVLFLPPALFCTFFAFPFGRDQPTETWALAKLRFWFKPRRRLWNQSGIKELVTITVPKKVERVLTNGLSQTEVKSRLQILADTIDSRGWAIKNATSGIYVPPTPDDSDRLVGFGSLPQEVPSDKQVRPGDDILDETNNPIAQQFDSMIDLSSRNRRQQLIDTLNRTQPQPEAASPASSAGPTASSQWFARKGGSIPGPKAADPDEADLAASLAAKSKPRDESLDNLRTMRPLAPAVSPSGPATAVPTDGQTAVGNQASTVTATPQPAILSLARNDDFNVATLAREADKNKSGNLSRDEVVISLH